MSSQSYGDSIKVIPLNSAARKTFKENTETGQYNYLSEHLKQLVTYSRELLKQARNRNKSLLNLSTDVKNTLDMSDWDNAVNLMTSEDDDPVLILDKPILPDPIPSPPELPEIPDELEGIVSARGKVINKKVPDNLKDLLNKVLNSFREYSHELEQYKILEAEHKKQMECYRRCKRIYNKLEHFRDELIEDSMSYELWFAYPFICGTGINAPLYIIPIDINFNSVNGTFQLRSNGRPPVLNLFALQQLQTDNNTASEELPRVFSSELSEFENIGIPLLPRELDKIISVIANLHPRIERPREWCEDFKNIQFRGVSKPLVIAPKAAIALMKRENVHLLSDLKELEKWSTSDIRASQVGMLLEPTRAHKTDEEWSNLSANMFPYPVNKEQIKVLERLKTSRSVVVQGPPGTGKSHTIANLVSLLAAYGKRVLVTSQQPKALEVVSNKLPEAIRKLCWMLHKNDKDSFTQLSETTNRIIEMCGDDTLQQVEQQLEEMKKLHRKAYEDWKKAQNNLKDVVDIETRNIRWGDSEIKPALAIQEYKSREEKGLNWVTDSVNNYCNISVESYTSYARQLLKIDLELKNVELFENENRVDYPLIKGLEKLEESLENKSKYLTALPKNYNWKSADNEEQILNSERNYIALKQKIDIIIRFFNENNLYHIYKPLWKIVYENQFSQNSREFLEKIISNLENEWQVLNKQLHNISDLKISLPDPREVYEAANTWIGILRKNKWSWSRPIAGMTKKKEKELLSRIFPDKKFTIKDLERVALCASLQEEFNSVMAKYNTHIACWQGVENTFAFNSIGLSQLKVGLEKCKRVLEAVTLITEFQKESVYSGLSFQSSVPSEDDFLNIRYNIETRTVMIALKKEEITIQKFINEFSLLNRGPFLLELCEYVLSGDLDGFRKKFVELRTRWPLLEQINKLREQGVYLSKDLPIFVKDLWGLARNEELNENLIADIPEAIKTAELRSKIHELESHFPLSTQELAKIEKEAREKEKDVRSKMIVLSIKFGLRNRLENSDLLHTLSFVSRLLLKSGTGTTAKQRRRWDEVRKNMTDLAWALPCWIMRIDDVARFLPLVPNLFDVVIFDESSQCDSLSAIPAAARANRMIVVGDEKQLSNFSNMFIKDAMVDMQIEKYLKGFPMKDVWHNKENSWFDLCLTHFPNTRVMLKEHFRCYPEIIKFCNDKYYKELKPVRTSHDFSLGQILNLVHVEGGYDENKVNRVEADAIIAKVKELLADPKYKGKTIGVMSFFREQTEYLKQKIREEFDYLTREERKLIAATADGFQGDERDVILFSYRYAPGASKNMYTLATKQDDKRRINVAYSRARDQIWCFVSAPIEDFPQNGATEFLHYVKNPSLWRIGTEDWDSGFEKDVHLALEQRGFVIWPQYPVGPYKIDLVVSDNKGNYLAVECDGYRYHYDKYGNLLPRDIKRQAFLEELDWNVVRICSRAYYKEPEKCIEEVVNEFEKICARKQQRAIEIEIEMINAEQHLETVNEHKQSNVEQDDIKQESEQTSTHNKKNSSTKQVQDKYVAAILQVLKENIFQESIFVERNDVIREAALWLREKGKINFKRLPQNGKIFKAFNRAIDLAVKYEIIKEESGYICKVE